MIYILAGDGFLESISINEYAANEKELMQLFNKKMNEMYWHTRNVIVDFDNGRINYEWEFIGAEFSNICPNKATEHFFEVRKVTPQSLPN